MRPLCLITGLSSPALRCDTDPMGTPIQPPHGGHLLVLLRHAKSDWTGGEPDHERDLAKRGRRQAPEAGAWLTENLDLDLAIVSTATRARRTWDLVAGEMPTPPPVRHEERVYAASARRLLDVVSELPEEVVTAVVVGHNPGLEDLVSSLADAWIRLPTSAIAVLSLAGPWSAVGDCPATLVTSGRPPT